MPRAYLGLEAHPADYRDAFAAGFAALDYQLVPARPSDPGPGDVMVIWNRTAMRHVQATAFEAAGAQVLVAENAYLQPPRGEKWFALSLSKHNGAGTWPFKTGRPVPHRWDQLGYTLKPWRSEGRYILVLPARGIGSPGVAEPREWLAQALKLIERRTKLPIKIRRHPGYPPTEPDDELADAYAAVVWGSSAGLKALGRGVPVFYGFRDWIGAPAGLMLHNTSVPEVAMMSDEMRLAMFQRLAWAQWSRSEIASGEALRWLLS